MWEEGFRHLKEFANREEMPRFLILTKLQMDIESVSGLPFNAEQKDSMSPERKARLEACPVGVGMLFQISGKKDFAISRNSPIVRAMQGF